MKIRAIMTAAATGVLLAIAGSSLTFAADWVCPRGYEDCQDYEYCTTHDHGNCDGYWDDEGSWICPDGTHSYCHTVSVDNTRTSAAVRGRGHHGSHGCGSHHR